MQKKWSSKLFSPKFFKFVRWSFQHSVVFLDCFGSSCFGPFLFLFFSSWSWFLCSTCVAISKFLNFDKFLESKMVVLKMWQNGRLQEVLSCKDQRCLVCLSQSGSRVLWQEVWFTQRWYMIWKSALCNSSKNVGDLRILHNALYQAISFL